MKLIYYEDFNISSEHIVISPVVVGGYQLIISNYMLGCIGIVAKGIGICSCHHDELVCEMSVQLYCLPGVVHAILVVVPGLAWFLWVELGRHEGVSVGLY